MVLPTLNELHTALQSGSALLDGAMILDANLDMRNSVDCLTLWRDTNDMGGDYPTHIIKVERYDDKTQCYIVWDAKTSYELQFLKAYNPFA